MVKYISAADTLVLRSVVLRNNAPLVQCVFPGDKLEESIHLGYFAGDRLVSVATFFPEPYAEKGKGGFRLRGMATDPEFLGKGCGSELIKFAINELRSVNASYIWCDARSAAVEFYKKQGFELISDEFEISGIGMHFKMIKNIR